MDDLQTTMYFPQKEDTNIPTECLFNLWRTWNVTFQMVKYRKYINFHSKILGEVNEIEDFEEWVTLFKPLLNLSPEDKSSELRLIREARKQLDSEVYSKIREAMEFTCEDKDGKSVLVMWYPSSKLGKKMAEAIEQKLTSRGIEILILLHNSKISPEAKKIFSTIRLKGIILDVFFDHELFVNIFTHPFVKPHIICSEKTKEEVFKTFNVRQEEGEYPGLPLIFQTDPPVKFIGARPGQLIKILRDSYTMTLPSGKRGTSVSYRLVI